MGQHKKGLAVWILIVLLLLAGALLAGSHPRAETVQEAMRDAVLHDVNQVSLFGLKNVNPGLISAFLVTAVLLLAAVLIRVFAIPRFQMIPGRLQLLLEQAVGLFDGMAKNSSPHRFRFVGAYIFAAGAFIFVGTLFELLGIQAVTVKGHPITLPAPLSDVNAAIALGTLSYLVSLSFVLPVIVGVLFTLLHAIIQTYVLTMLTSMYYGEVSEPSPAKPKKKKQAASSAEHA